MRRVLVPAIRKYLRKCQKEEAVQALIEERGLPKNFTGTLEYNGFKIVVWRPKSYTKGVEGLTVLDNVQLTVADDFHRL